MVDHAQHRNQQVDLGRRIDNHPRLHPMLLNQLQRAVQVPAGLIMDAHPVGSGLCERLHKLIRILNHHVAIERQVRRFPQRLHHRRPNRQVGHKMAVHHVHVDHAPASALGGANLLAQTGKIGGKNRWKQFNQDKNSLPAVLRCMGGCAS